MRSVCLVTLGVLLAGTLYAQDAKFPSRLTLEDALRIAEARNPGVAAARHSLAGSEAEVVAAGTRPNPALTLSSEGIPFSQRNRPPFLDNQELTLGVEQELEPGGRRRLRTEAAKYGVEASRASVEEALRLLRFDVRRAYMQVVLARADEEVARTTLEGIDRVLAVNRARYEQGELSGVELRRLQVERFRFADDLFAAELASRNARSALLALMHVTPLDRSFEAVDGLPSAPGLPSPNPAAGGVSAATEQALANRPDLAAVRREHDRAQAELQLQRALRTPSLTVGAGMRRDFGTNGLLVTLAVPLPVFDRNAGGIARAGAQERRAAAGLATAETRVSLDVQEAWNAVDVCRRRLAYVEGEYLRSALEARDIVLASYRSGAATLIDYLDAERSLREALRTQNRARFDYRVSVFQFEAAVATPTPTHGTDLP